jgi:hypothetical protein
MCYSRFVIPFSSAQVGFEHIGPILDGEEEKWKFIWHAQNGHASSQDGKPAKRPISHPVQ